MPIDKEIAKTMHKINPKDILSRNSKRRAMKRTPTMQKQKSRLTENTKRVS
jgi:hypothetical protein